MTTLALVGSLALVGATCSEPGTGTPPPPNAKPKPAATVTVKVAARWTGVRPHRTPIDVSWTRPGQPTHERKFPGVEGHFDFLQPMKTGDRVSITANQWESGFLQCDVVLVSTGVTLDYAHRNDTGSVTCAWERVGGD